MFWSSNSTPMDNKCRQGLSLPLENKMATTYDVVKNKWDNAHKTLVTLPGHVRSSINVRSHSSFAYWFKIC